MKQVIVSPWSSGTKVHAALPEDAVLACAYEVDIGLVSFDEVAFFRQTDEADELWVAEVKDASSLRKVVGAAPGGGLGPTSLEKVFCAVIAPREQAHGTTCVGLLRHLFRSRVGFAWPTRFSTSGLVTEARYRRLLDDLEAELDRNVEEAGRQESEIVSAARELGLHPEPSGTGRDHWKASCPETNHPLYIDSGTNVFGCGWCKRKGGVAELRAFVEERRRKLQRSL